MRFEKLFLNLYLLAAIVHVYAVAAYMDQIDTITKYLLMPFLLLYVVFYPGRRWKDILLLMGALVFSWFGDVLLLYTGRNEQYFMFGLGAFLIAHLFYIFCFRKYRFTGPTIKWYVILPILAYSGCLLIYIIPNLDDMLVPVIAYAIVITVMAIAALLRKGRTTDYSFYFTFIGALLFVISDSLIAVNKFVESIPNGSLLIMITYIMAQYLIVNGCLIHIKEQNE